MPIESLTSGGRSVLARNVIAARGYLTESLPWHGVTTQLTLTGGTAYGVLLPVYQDMTATNAVVQVQAAGTATTHCKVGLFSLDGTTRYAATADTTTPLNSTGLKTIAFAAAWTVPDGVTACYAVIFATATTTVPTITFGPAMQTGAAALTNFNYPVVTGGTGLTDLPATPVTFTASATLGGFWVGIT